MTKLIRLIETDNSKDSQIVDKYIKTCLSEFDGDLTVVIMGTAYGGDMEVAAQILKGRGKVYGYDTFDGHPKQLAREGEDFARDCMDYWYKEHVFGREKLSYEYQRKVLDNLGLDNAILKKGLVTPESCSEMEKIHLAFLDMDLYASMKAGYEAVENKIVPGGYLLLHDAIAPDHIKEVYELYQNEIMPTGKWEHLENGVFLVCLKKVDL